jgi:flagellar hook-associated protein 2
MGRIQSNVGLITGIDIGGTVDKLMQVASQPRDTLSTRNDGLKSQQAAVTELSALLLAVRYMTDNLGKEAVFDKQEATSSNDAALSASVTGQPAAGLYQFIPVRTAQRQQLLASGVRSDTDPMGGGRLTFRFGDHVERGTRLDVLNGGAGIVRGKIRITDRSGASAEIDLSTAQTIDDVLEAINTSGSINVTAEARGDRLRLVDHTGQTQSNLKVQEVGRGSTAASLGLDSIDLAASTADGRSVLSLAGATELSALNDGLGFSASTVLPDVAFTLRDGTTGQIDFSPIISGTSRVDREITLGDVLKAINAASPGKLKAEIGPDGERLVLTDLTTGDGTFSLDALYGSGALADLGLDVAASEGTITGRRILGPLRGVLLSSLGGGSGLGTLGAIELTDRSGMSDTVDLSHAETLQDVVDTLNTARVGIVARVNDARNGILLTDTTGAAAGHLIVANADGTQTADKLRVAVDADVSSVNGGDLQLKVVGLGTKLSELNGGTGVALGKITLYDTLGQHAQVDLANGLVSTVGDVIAAINRLNLGLRAEINSSGDGILVRDTAHGAQALRIVDDTSTAAADLHLTGAGTLRSIDGTPTQVIDGSMTYTIDVTSEQSLGDLVKAINDLHAGVTARVFNDGSSRPYRLLLSSDATGAAGQLVVDASGLPFSLQETARARDALLAMALPGGTGANVLLASPSNEFLDAIPGVRLEIKQPSSTPVTITVDRSDADFMASVKTMVDNYNKFRKKLADDTAYDVTADKASVLTGDLGALRLETELAGLLSGPFAGAGTIRSLGELGLRVTDDGTLELDEATLKARFAEDPQAVKDFFTKAETGFSARFKQLTDQLAGDDTSLLSQRLKTLDQKIQQNQDKIDFMDKRLAAQRDRLLLEFYNLEIAVAKIQTNQKFLDLIKPLDTTTTTTSSSIL